MTKMEVVNATVTGVVGETPLASGVAVVQAILCYDGKHNDSSQLFIMLLVLTDRGKGDEGGGLAWCSTQHSNRVEATAARP